MCKSARAIAERFDRLEKKFQEHILTDTHPKFSPFLPCFVCLTAMFMTSSPPRDDFRCWVWSRFHHFLSHDLPRERRCFHCYRGRRFDRAYLLEFLGGMSAPA